MKLTFSFDAELWEHSGEAPWVFVTIPQAYADEIDDAVPKGPGFGSVKVTVTIGATTWPTSLFPSKELASYVLPVKRAVRHSEGLEIGEVVLLTLSLEMD